LNEAQRAAVKESTRWEDASSVARKAKPDV